jgi:hypothetical protein
MADGFINIHGKQYATVAHRLQQFRTLYPAAQILTELTADDGKKVIMRSEIYINGLIIADGWAEEVRGSSNINKTSALENCQTSAIGRALAIAGFDTSGHICSADEVSVAIERQRSVAIERQKNEANTAIKTLDKMAKKAKLTKKQQKALENHLDECTDGDIKLQKVLAFYKIDNLSELSKQDAEQAVTKLEITA